MACGVLHCDKQILLPQRAPSLPNENQGEGAPYAMQLQMEIQQKLPPGGAQQWFHHLLQLPKAFSSRTPPPRAPPGMTRDSSTNNLEEWVGGTASLLPPPQHIEEPYCTPKAD